MCKNQNLLSVFMNKYFRVSWMSLPTWKLVLIFQIRISTIWTCKKGNFYANFQFNSCFWCFNLLKEISVCFDIHRLLLRWERKLKILWRHEKIWKIYVFLSFHLRLKSSIIKRWFKRMQKKGGKLPKKIRKIFRHSHVVVWFSCWWIKNA